jgi:hypothetical protein
VQLLQDLLDALPGGLNNSYGWALAEVSYSCMVALISREKVHQFLQPFLNTKKIKRSQIRDPKKQEVGLIIV